MSGSPSEGTGTADRRPAQPDLIVVALASLLAGAAAGAALIAAGLAVLRDMLAGALPLIVFVGAVGAVACSWTLARPIDDTWRRALTATIGAFGSLILAGLTAPADLVAGRVGLAAYATVLVVVALVVAQRARRAAHP